MNLKTSINIQLFLLKAFFQQFELNSATNIREVMKFYDLGDQSFETDNRSFCNNWVLQVTDNGTDCHHLVKWACHFRR